jgi:hypothetical protein
MGKLSVGDIPGYQEAVDTETLNRELAYTGTQWIVCGVPINAITPAILTELYAAGSPFVCGGFPEHADVAHLLIACGMTVKHRESKLRTWLFNRKITKAVRRKKWGLDECVADIEQFVDIMFQDAPSGGVKSIPYASSAAWMEFAMAGEPWRWPREKTMHTAIPIIYQQVRCLERSRGHSVSNPSDFIRARWLDQINSVPPNLS